MAKGDDRSILLVEDDRDVRDTLAAVLEDEGFRALEAANGAEALSMLGRGARPRVILLDLTMPVMDGWTFREKQRSSPELAQIPVVLVSAIQNLEREAQRLGAQGYLEKPVPLDSLLGTVARFCA